MSAVVVQRSRPAEAAPLGGVAPAVPVARALVGRRIDAWLVGGFGLVAWLILTVAPPGSFGVPTGLVYWILVGLSATHFGSSYHLAYGQGGAWVRQRWLPLIAVPAALIVATFALIVVAGLGDVELSAEGAQLLLVLVFSLTAWHYIKQVYGVARLGATLEGLSLDRASVKVLRYGLYPIWILDALDVWRVDQVATYRGVRAGYAIVPTGVAQLAVLASWIGAAVLVGAFVRLACAWRRLPPAMMLTPYALALLWFLAPPSYLSATVVLAALHALQYLACAHRAEVEWAVERRVESTVWWWTCAFAAATAAGILLVHWLPARLTDAGSVWSLGPIPAIALFVAFNLHHYAVDATIWRSRDDHVRRISRGARVLPHQPAI